MKTKNTLISVIALAAIGLALTGAPIAAQVAGDLWSLTSTDNTVGSSNTWLVVPSSGGKTPVVNALRYTSDKAASRITFKEITGTLTLASTNTSATNIVVNNTAWVVTNGNDIVLYDQGDRVGVLRSILSATTGAVYLTQASGRTLLAGDQIYLVSTAASVPCGIATNPAGGAISPPGHVWKGQASLPLLILMDYTADGQIDLATGEYLPNARGN
jgi:hypothetical protein